MEAEKRIICCNEWYEPLTKIEKDTYSIVWQFSGDMYCTKHENRPQFVEKRKNTKNTPLDKR